ncbi:MAG: type II toxin-antitoxin system VapC family toxin [Chloroflexi bacterium]|nr:type II toxin-antitoxin system VapC family toxin [Chloroflexota bacterium]
MMVKVAIDSSMLVALLVTNDLWHSQAVALWETIEDAGHIGVYFDCVAVESVSVAARRLHEKGRLAEVELLLDRLNAHVPSSTITWILPDVPHLYPEVLALIRSSSGALNFNDALIALACRERGILAIASFDVDFDGIPWLRRLAHSEDVAS